MPVRRSPGLHTAAREPGMCPTTSRPYVSFSNSLVERAARHVEEGTRTVAHTTSTKRRATPHEQSPQRQIPQDCGVRLQTGGRPSADAHSSNATEVWATAIVQGNVWATTSIPAGSSGGILVRLNSSEKLVSAQHSGLAPNTPYGFLNERSPPPQGRPSLPISRRV